MPIVLDQALYNRIKREAEKHNLPPFEGKGFPKKGVFVDLNAYLIPKVPKSNEIWKWSDPVEVKKKADAYFGYDKPIYISVNKGKKYMLQDPKGKWVHFGQLNYEDHTHHHNEDRRSNYLRRTAKMKGNWKDNEYSANNLSRNILW